MALDIPESDRPNAIRCPEGGGFANGNALENAGLFRFDAKRESPAEPEITYGKA